MLQIVGGRYRLKSRVLKGDARHGVPDLWTASDAGDLHFVKIWRRQANDDDIRALWNREVRGLMRLQGHPGAGELFVRLLQLGIEEKHYFAVLEGGRRQPLSVLLDKRSNYHWLTNLRELGRRRVIWEGLLRIAEGLAALHRDGTLHRSLGPHSVFVGPDGTDFRLSGFEWSLRIAGSEGAAIKVAAPRRLLPHELESATSEYSTASDWFAFGTLCAELMGVSPLVYRKREQFRTAIEALDHLNSAERSLIRELIAEDPDERLLDESFVLRSIRDVLRSFNVATLGANRPLVVSLRLGPSSDLARQIESASEKRCPVGDPPAQLAWARNDLRGDFKLVARNSPQPHFVLRGERLEYRVLPWTFRGSSHWDIGFCDAIELPRTYDDDQVYSRGERTVDIRSFTDAHDNHHSIRNRAATWDKLFPFARERSSLPANLRDIHDFFRVTQQLDVALTAATICPMRIVAIDTTNEGTEVEVTPAEEAERKDLAQLLQLGPPADQIRDWFALGVEPIEGDDENQPSLERYSLLTRKIIGREVTSDVVWKFSSARHDPAGPRYRFKCQTNPPLAVGARVYLARGFGGTIAQLRRRDDAIENLRSHETLLALIDDPIGVSRANHDSLPPAIADIALDDSKRDALQRLWQTEPSFAVQGPPGTGKTTLIRAFADRLIGADSSAQILITAHSHHTVDDVLSKLADLFATHPAATRPILVRLGSDSAGSHGPEAVAIELLETLAQSDLAAAAAPELRERLASAQAAGTEGAINDREFRTFQLLAQDAANITCVTSNSPELAKIVARGRRFDWSIIEEAGKAHGFDMALALQESHRLLLIGDHHQLPPFNAQTYIRLLEDPARVREAIRKGATFAPNLIDTSLVDDEEGRPDLEERCRKWREMVEFFGLVFRGSLGVEESGKGPAATLSDQHRMHPHIADLVGRTFYPNEEGGTLLTSPDETKERFAAPPPYLIAPGSWLPEQRIVWCDVGWVQQKEFSQGETIGLFEAPSEVDAIMRVLGELRPAPGRDCDLQILSPYNNQLAAIRRRLDQERHDGKLAAMFEEPFDLKIGKRMGATVDEFQGSEADIVVASLVRNNGLPPRASLGFLRQGNRPNVLLSRARHKLIIVGSWKFFRSRCNAETSPYEEHAYIGRMMDAMEEARAAGHLAFVEMQP